MSTAYVHFWNRVPALRFLLSLMAGILLQWYVQAGITTLLVCFIIFLTLTLVYNLLRITFRAKLSWLHGILFQLIFVVIGGLLVWLNDTRNQEDWFGKDYSKELDL